MNLTLEEISFEYANLYWSISTQLDSFMSAMVHKNTDYMFDLAKYFGFPHDFGTFEEMITKSGLINLNLGKEQMISRFIRFMVSNKSR